MPFILNPKRKYEFTYTDGDNSLTAIFDFPCVEDRNNSKIRKKLEGVNVSKIATGDKDQDTIDIASNLIWYNIRTALKEIHGVVEEGTITEECPEGKEITFYNEDGSINEDMQKAVLEFLITLPAEEGKESIRDQVYTAFLGPIGKN